MVMTPVTRTQRRMGTQPRGAGPQRQSGGVNGVAFFVFFVLMTLSILIAVPMASSGIHWVWIAAELLILNLISTYILIAFKVANQWGGSSGSKDRVRSGSFPSWTQFPCG